MSPATLRAPLRSIAGRHAADRVRARIDHRAAEQLAALLALALGWGFLEYKTLSDDIPNNHITAVVRAAVKAQPGPFVLLMFAIGFLCGHLFWP